ncbi:carboxymuconolactone decarboxylase family protein [Streptomyces sp. NEAU-YJ-81]|uniref:carboxymuconolactone decarboxylase family protein n=1 Tax=Streptomyces sp. NEAU-YJ-81 TaxID=2820288 RepID=UPI001FBBF7B4|nr:carboxymuconolactone decarboxylase family protein [Streptomyces sp. NEAU-YJ-81]
MKIRASQINGCAFCLRMHTRDALKKGENSDRIAVLPGWEETGYFSETDRAALHLTEAVTRVSDGHVSDENYNDVAAVLTSDQVSAVVWLATVMNAFNRVAITVTPEADPTLHHAVRAPVGHPRRPERSHTVTGTRPPR